MEDEEEKKLIKKKNDSSFNLRNGINDEKFELVSNLYNVMCPYCSCITFYNIKIIIIYFIKFNHYNINYSKKNYFL
jgi:hypothetical protein